MRFQMLSHDKFTLFTLQAQGRDRWQSDRLQSQRSFYPALGRVVEWPIAESELSGSNPGVNFYF